MPKLTSMFGPEGYHPEKENSPETETSAENLAESAAAEALQGQVLPEQLKTPQAKRQLKDRLKNTLRPLLTGSTAGFLATVAGKSLIRNSFRLVLGSSFGVGIAAGAAAGATMEGVKSYLKEKNKYVASDILEQLNAADSSIKKAAVLQKAEAALKEARISRPEQVEELSHIVRLTRVELEAKAASANLADKSEAQKLAYILKLANNSREKLGKSQKKKVERLIKEIKLKTEKSQVNKMRVLQAALKGAAIGALGGAVGGAAASWLAEHLHPDILHKAAEEIASKSTGGHSPETAAAAARELLQRRAESSANAFNQVLNHGKEQLLEAKYQAIAEKGDGLTNLARKSLHDYITNALTIDHTSPLQGLTPEQLVFAEDTLVKEQLRSGASSFVQLGQHVEFSGQNMAAVLDKAKNLTPAELHNLSELLKTKEHFLPAAIRTWMTAFGRPGIPQNNFAGPVLEQAKAAAEAAAREVQAAATASASPSHMPTKLAEAASHKWLENLAWYTGGLATGAAGGILGYKYYLGRKEKQKAQQEKPTPTTEGQAQVPQEIPVQEQPPVSPSPKPQPITPEAIIPIPIIVPTPEEPPVIVPPAESAPQPPKPEQAPLPTPEPQPAPAPQEQVTPEQAQATEEPTPTTTTEVITPTATQEHQPTPSTPEPQIAPDLTETTNFNQTLELCRQQLPRFTGKFEQLDNFKSASLETRKLLLDSIIVLLQDHPQTASLLESLDIEDSSQDINAKGQETLTIQLLLNGQEVNFVVDNFNGFTAEDIAQDVWEQMEQTQQVQAQAVQPKVIQTPAPPPVITPAPTITPSPQPVIPTPAPTAPGNIAPQPSVITPEQQARQELEKQYPEIYQHFQEAFQQDPKMKDRTEVQNYIYSLLTKAIPQMKPNKIELLKKRVLVFIFDEDQNPNKITVIGEFINSSGADELGFYIGGKEVRNDEHLVDSIISSVK